MVAVSWPVSPGEHVESSVLAAMIGDLPVLVVSVNVREPNGSPPVVHVAVDGVVLEILEMRRVASVAELGGIFRAEVPLPGELIDGVTHRLEVVAAAYTPADETRPEMPAYNLEAPVGYGSHEVLFYAKRFSNRPR